MRPEAVADFVAFVSREMNAGCAEESAPRLTSERGQIKRRLNRLYDALADGLPAAGLTTKLEDIDAQIINDGAK